jgi:hypothetical protein
MCDNVQTKPRDLTPNILVVELNISCLVSCVQSAIYKQSLSSRVKQVQLVERPNVNELPSGSE